MESHALRRHVYSTTDIGDGYEVLAPGQRGVGDLGGTHWCNLNIKSTGKGRRAKKAVYRIYQEQLAKLADVTGRAFRSLKKLQGMEKWLGRHAAGDGSGEPEPRAGYTKREGRYARQQTKHAARPARVRCQQRNYWRVYERFCQEFWNSGACHRI